MSPNQLAGNRDRGAGNALRRIVRISEGIKRVTAAAFKINLMAMNAIFLAKRAGQSALGFGVLSHELRQFATDLQRQMENLKRSTHEGVAAMTGQVRQVRIERILQDARNRSGQRGRATIDQCLRMRDAAACFQATDGSFQERHLSQQISDTLQLVELGSVLARSAKIEAAYGGGFSVALMQVSSDFEQVIGEIQGVLAGLTKRSSLETAL